MLDLPTALLAHLQSREARMARLLVWVRAIEKSNGNPATIGFWTGADHRVFTIAGEDRTYLGTGSLLKIAPIIGETGVNVRTTRLTFSGASPEFQAAVTQYNTNDAPVEIHIANFNATTHSLIAEPQRRFKGFLKGIDFPRAALGGEATAEVSVQSAARVLTRSLPLRKSDEALRQRHPGDRFRRYNAVSGAIPVVWGTLRK